MSNEKTANKMAKKIYSVWLEDSDEVTDNYLETIEEAMKVCKDLGWDGYSSVIEEIDEKTGKTLAWYDADGNPLKN